MIRRKAEGVLVTLLFLGGMFIITPQEAQGADTYYWTKHTPDMDSYVRRDQPTTNYGTSELKMSDDDFQIFLCWNLTGITAGATMVTAQVWLYNVDDSTHASQADYLVCYSPNNWTEGGITWNNRPRIPDIGTTPALAVLVENYTGHEWAIGGDSGGSLTSTVQSVFDGTGRLDIGINYTTPLGHVRTYEESETAITEYRPALWLYWYVAGPTVYYWTYNIYPEADATVSEEAPNTVFGLEPTLEICKYPYEKEVYFRFNLTWYLPADAYIVSAELWLWKESDTVMSGNLAVCYHYLYYNFDPDWSESELDWDAKPRLGALPLVTFDSNNDLGWVHASNNALSERVRLQFNSTGDAYLSLYSEFTDEGQRTYVSKDGADGRKPYLKVTYWSPTHQWPQPPPDEPGIPWVGDLAGMVQAILGVVGFVGMIAVPSLMIYWYRHGAEGIPSIVNTIILWTLCFAFFCTAIVW